MIPNDGSSGRLWGWGRNGAGQLLGADYMCLNPYGLRVTEGTKISAGAGHCLLIEPSGVISWGTNNKGQLGHATSKGTTDPVGFASVMDEALPLGFWDDVVAVSAGGIHSLALMNDKTVKAWGDNFYGQLGIKLDIPRSQLPL